MKRVLAIVVTICLVMMFFTACGSEKKATNASNKKVTVEAIELNYYTTTLNEGQTLDLEATVTPSDAKDYKLSWVSSDNSVAVVNSEGTITAVSGGVANIICKSDNGIEVSCTVTVKGEKIIVYGHYKPSYVYVASDFVFPESSTRYLSESEISSVLRGMTGPTVSGSYAQDAINEIYARNGYVFKTPSIKAYYESQPWYYPDPSFTTNDFNEYEKYNIALLKKY